jgi:hypothetical protein
MNTLPEDDLPELVSNMDETCRRLHEAMRRAVEEKEAETGKLQSHQSKKTSFIAFGGIPCSGDKLPLWVIAKGKTGRSEAKFGSHPGIIIKHGENGWATENLIIECVQWFHTEIAGGQPCALILDVYPTHRTGVLMAAAEGCDVELLFVPEGGTSEYQPLDYRIFGELTSPAKAEMTRLMAIRGVVNIDDDQGVTILVKSWNAISGESICPVWHQQ